MQILTLRGTNEYNHSTKCLTRIVENRGYVICLDSKLPKKYKDLDSLELLNTLTNIDHEDFTALAEFQKGLSNV